MGPVQWPEIFVNENFVYPYSGIEKTHRYAAAVADGLCGWANCHLDGDIPEHFGKGMAKISEIVGSASPDRLNKAADELLISKETP